MSTPRVHSYIDYRAFLRDWFEARKVADPDYSYAEFAAAAECARSSLANAISGARRPRPDTLDAFARAMELSAAERNYLGLLVDLASAGSIEDRRAVMHRILSAERHQQVRMAESEPEEAVARYLGHWYIPAIHELVAIPGFREDPAWIASQLRPRIDPRDAQDALDLLLELDLVRRRPDGTLEQAAIRFRTRPEAYNAAAFHFHREVVPGLLRTIDARHAGEQHLLAATITLPPDLVPEAKAMLNAVIEQLATLADDRGTHEVNRIYQVAIQLLPLSDAIR